MPSRLLSNCLSTDSVDNDDVSAAKIADHGGTGCAWLSLSRERTRRCRTLMKIQRVAAGNTLSETRLRLRDSRNCG